MKLPRYAKKSEYIGRGLETFNLSRALFSEIKNKLKKQKKVKLLEVGTGKGILLLQLAEKFPKNLELHGLNLNKYHGLKKREDFVINAKEKGISAPSKSNLPYIHFGDATNLNFKNGNFDIIISQVTFIHIKNKAQALTEVYRTLKTGGLAIISLGSYSISRKIGHAMPAFYKNLNKKLKDEYNPRFLIKSGGKYISFNNFLLRLNKKYSINLWRKKFVSKSQRGNVFYIIIRKEKNGLLDINLKYNKKESEKLTKLYAEKNPVVFGCIDVYDLEEVQ
ncbi:MAG: class I SAM-dependent methyltransferase [Candidatus Nanoarchaeia archaeon]|nr:class I SAM-dependent methyltransferase [Candidatus Nanoarchaeia archaeon]